MSELTQEDAQAKYVDLVNDRSPGWNAAEMREAGTGPVFSRPVMYDSEDCEESLSDLSEVILRLP